MRNNKVSYSHKPRCCSQYINLILQTIIAFTLLLTGLYLLKIRNSYGYNLIPTSKPILLIEKSIVMFIVVIIYAIYGEKLVTTLPYICVGILPSLIVIGGFVPIAAINTPIRNTNDTFIKCCKSINPDINKCSFIKSKNECSSFDYFRILQKNGPSYLAWIYVPLSFISFILIMFYPFVTYKLLKYENKLPPDILQRENEQYDEYNRRDNCPIFSSNSYDGFKKKHYMFLVPLVIISILYLIANVYMLMKRQNYGYNIISLTRCIIWIVLSSVLVIITLFFKTVSVKCKTHPNEGYYIYSFMYFVFCSSLFVIHTADIFPTVLQINDTYEKCCVENINLKQCDNVINNDYGRCENVHKFYNSVNGDMFELLAYHSALLLLYMFISLLGGLLTYNKNKDVLSKEEAIKINLI